MKKYTLKMTGDEFCELYQAVTEYYEKANFTVKQQFIADTLMSKVRMLDLEVLNDFVDEKLDSKFKRS